MKNFFGSIGAIIGAILFGVLLILSGVLAILSVFDIVFSFWNMLLNCAWVLFVIASIFLIYMIYKLNDAKSKKEYVAWCASESNKIRCNLRLLEYIHKVQTYDPSTYRMFPYDPYPNINKMSPTPKQYRINEDEEWQKCEDILIRYQKYMIEKYFSGATLKIGRLTKAEYFMMTLMDFLEVNEYDTKAVSKIVYLKLYYTTQSYFANLTEKDVGKKVAWVTNARLFINGTESQLKEILQTKQK